MNHQFMELGDVYLANSFISSDAYLRHSDRCEKCLYHRSDAIFRKRNWRGESHPALLTSKFRKSRSNLILGHSDQKTQIMKSLLLHSLGYERIFGINVNPYENISIPIPIGLTNNTDESDYHRLFGNNDLLSVANSVDFLSDSNGLVYGCFSTTTNVKERLPLASILSASHHTFEKPTFSLTGRVRYLEKLRRHAFTVCPVGNGVDTHRLWEVLYMGGIPIIRKNRILESLLVDLPFVLVNNWEQIEDSIFLQESWEKLSRGTYDFDKLKFNYWIDFIHTSWSKKIS